MTGGVARGVIALAALCTASLAGPLTGAPAPDDSIRFRYAPPDGYRVVLTTEVTSEKDLGAVGRISDRRVSRTALEFRRVKDGFTVTSRTLSAEATRDGKPYADALLDVMRRMSVVYHVGPDGELRRIDGLAGVIDTLMSSQPLEVVQALAPILSPDAVFAREAAEWNGRYRDYADATLKVGDRLEGDVPFTLPNGDAISYRVVTTIAAREPCAGKACVRIEILYDSDLAAMSRLLDDVTGKLTRAAGADSLAPSTSAARVSGTVARLVNPATLQIHSEVAKRVMRMTVRVAGHDPIPAVMTETRTYTYREP